MCFNGYMSGGFAALGLYCAWWIRAKTSNKRLSNAVFFFFLMEFLQFLQYFVLAANPQDPYCKSVLNTLSSIASWIHICSQPIFVVEINASLCQQPNPKNAPEHNQKLERYHAQYTVISRLCAIGGFLLFMRWPLSYLPGWNTMKEQKSTEWLRGSELCTYKTPSMVHLGWSVPMADPTYNIMGAGIHSFLMFAPFFAMYDKKGMIIQGILLWASGPGVAAMITSNLQEQASVWCFFSIAQIAILLFLVREALLTHWSKSGQAFSLTKGGHHHDVAAKNKAVETIAENGNGNGKKKSAKNQN